MDAYLHPNRGNAGPFPAQDNAKRKLDAAGKLVHQPARQDLKKTNYVDKARRPSFKNF